VEFLLFLSNVVWKGHEIMITESSEALLLFLKGYRKISKKGWSEEGGGDEERDDKKKAGKNTRQFFGCCQFLDTLKVESTLWAVFSLLSFSYTGCSLNDSSGMRFVFNLSFFHPLPLHVHPVPPTTYTGKVIILKVLGNGSKCLWHEEKESRITSVYAQFRVLYSVSK
jgi:hypothetical protein